MADSAGVPWPLELKVDGERRRLTIAFDDGRTFELPAEFLRVLSPSAEVKGHGTGQRVTVGGKKDVRILRLEPVGNYAVRIVFDDGHDTGLYTWEYLDELGENRERLWQEHLADLAAKGLSQ